MEYREKLNSNSSPEDTNTVLEFFDGLELFVETVWRYTFMECV